MNKIEFPISPELASAITRTNEITASTKVLYDQIQKNYKPFFDKINSTLLLNRKITENFSSVTQVMSETLSRSSLINIQVASQSLKLIADSLPHALDTSRTEAIIDIWKANFSAPLFKLNQSDFRIGVVSQELEKEITSRPKECIEALLFKETPKPSNDFEAKFFDILNDQRKILNNHTEILNKIDNSQSENIKNEKSDKSHSSPSSYRNKAWYIEQFEANLIAIFIAAVISATVGEDPSNTIQLVLILGCLLRFIS